MNTPQKILIMENDLSCARTLRDGLKPFFPEIHVVFDGAMAVRETGILHPDFLLADVSALADVRPDAFCLEIRALSEAPLLLFAGRTLAGEKVRALNAGADDFLEKPLDARELAAKMLAIWRRYLTQPPASPAGRDTQKSVEYPQLSISLSNYTVLRSGQLIEMPPKELELLYFLASSPNRVFTREQLLDHIWGYDSIVDARTVDVHVKRIREKIKDHETWSLDTVWGVGYKFSLASTQTLSASPKAASEKSDSA